MNVNFPSGQIYTPQRARHIIIYYEKYRKKLHLKRLRVIAIVRGKKPSNKSEYDARIHLYLDHTGELVENDGDCLRLIAQLSHSNTTGLLEEES